MAPKKFLTRPSQNQRRIDAAAATQNSTQKTTVSTSRNISNQSPAAQKKQKEILKPHQSVISRPTSTLSQFNATPHHINHHSTNFQQTIVDKNLAHVSFIYNPNRFYVHNPIFRTAAASFYDQCKRDALYAARPGAITMDEMYLVPKENNWYRGKVQEKLSTEKGNSYSVFFVDYGFEEIIAEYRY